MGAQFLRTATVDLTGLPTLIANREGSTLTPNSIAFKLKKNPAGHLTKEYFDGLQIKYGKNAINFLKKNPENGAAFIGRIMGRNSTNEFPVPQIATASEMFAIVLKELLSSKELIGVEGVTITLPAYFTYKQREAVIKSIWTAHHPFLGIIDDFNGIIHLYTQKYIDRFRNDNHSVLFVDVGAAHAAAYRVDFYVNATTIVANQTSYEWSEETGSISFAKAIAEAKGISFSKAMKLVQQGKFDPDLIASEIEELQRIVLLASGNEDIDNMQLFGGASRLSCVEEALKSTTGYPISRELSTGDATVLGGALITQLIANKATWPITIIRSPVYTSKVRCGNVSVSYCSKGVKCTDMVILDNTICEHLYIDADESEVPSGAPSLLSDYLMTNISKWDREDEEIVSGIVLLQEPMPIITHVNWCITSTLNCQPISGKHFEVPLKSYQNSVDFVSDVKTADQKLKRIASLRGQIHGLVEQMQFGSTKGSEEEQKILTDKANKVAEESKEIEELEEVIHQLRDQINSEL